MLFLYKQITMKQSFVYKKRALFFHTSIIKEIVPHENVKKFR